MEFFYCFVIAPENVDSGSLILGAWMIELMRSGDNEDEVDDKKGVLIPASQLPSIDSESQG